VRYHAMDGWWENVITGAEGRNDDNWYARGSVTKTDVFAVTVDWELGFATLTSISAYSAYDSESEPGNTDMAAVPALARTKLEDYEQYSQEIRLVSPGNGWQPSSGIRQLNPEMQKAHRYEKLL